MVAEEAMTANVNSGAHISMAGAMPLAMLGPNDIKKVVSIRGKDDVRRFLTNLGFAENAEVRVVSELNGNLIVAVKGARVAISRAMASRVMVR